MEIKLLKKEGNLYEIEFKDEDIGVLNLIKEILVNREDVEFAASLREHPMVSQPKLIFRTDKDAKKILHAAIKEAMAQLDKLETALSK